MKLIVTHSYEESAALSAQMISQVFLEKPEAVMGLATGTTPVSVYKYMVKAQKEGKADFSRAQSINLDEYIGLDPENVNSYMYFMREHLFNHIGILPENIYIPNGIMNPDTEIVRMNRFLDENSLDVQLLSVGTNGHIGFNEPGEVFYDKYHVVELTEETRRSNSRLFSSLDEVPREAITMGAGGIMRAQKIVFLATGSEKLYAMKAILEEGNVTPQIPGTILKFHRDCTIIIDEMLARQITPASGVEVVHC